MYGLTIAVVFAGIVVFCCNVFGGDPNLDRRLDRTQAELQDTPSLVRGEISTGGYSLVQEYRELCEFALTAPDEARRLWSLTRVEFAQAVERGHDVIRRFAGSDKGADYLSKKSR
jgi:hypothetical protein